MGRRRFTEPSTYLTIRLSDTSLTQLTRLAWFAGCPKADVIRQLLDEAAAELPPPTPDEALELADVVANMPRSGHDNPSPRNPARRLGLTARMNTEAIVASVLREEAEVPDWPADEPFPDICPYPPSPDPEVKRKRQMWLKEFNRRERR